MDAVCSIAGDGLANKYWLLAADLTRQSCLDQLINAYALWSDFLLLPMFTMISHDLSFCCELWPYLANTPNFVDDRSNILPADIQPRS